MSFDDQSVYFDDLRDTIFDYRGTKKIQIYIYIYIYIYISAVKVNSLITHARDVCHVQLKEFELLENTLQICGGLFHLICI